jgi:hypothetical protein
MKKPLYREALKHSWKLAWKHKWLWPLGLFAAFWGQMGMLELLSAIGVFDSPTFLSELFVDVSMNAKGFSFGFLSGLPVDGWVSVAWLATVFIGVGMFMAFVATVSQGALIHVAAASTKKKKGLPPVDKSWHAGVSHFWRLFAINIFKKMILLTLSITIGWYALQGAGSVVDIFLFLAVFISAALVGLVVSFLVIYAAGYVVVEEQGLWDAIDSAWKLFMGHWLVSIEVGIILLLLNIAMGVVATLSIFGIFIPTLLIWIVAAVLGSTPLFATATVLAFLLLSLFIIFLGSLFSVFSVSTWTYLFMKMHKHGVRSKTHHWLKG